MVSLHAICLNLSFAAPSMEYCLYSLLERGQPPHGLLHRFFLDMVLTRAPSFPVSCDWEEFDIGITLKTKQIFVSFLCNVERWEQSFLKARDPYFVPDQKMICLYHISEIKSYFVCGVVSCIIFRTFLPRFLFPGFPYHSIQPGPPSYCVPHHPGLSTPSGGCSHLAIHVQSG